MSFVAAAEVLLQRARAGLYEAGTMLMAESQPLVPVETGTLKRSGRVEEPVEEADRLVVTVGYGYGSEYAARVAENDPEDHTGYAVYVHEDLEARHDPPTSAKYLEIPAKAMDPQLPEIVAAAMREG